MPSYSGCFWSAGWRGGFSRGEGDAGGYGGHAPCGAGQPDKPTAVGREGRKGLWMSGAEGRRRKAERLQRNAPESPRDTLTAVIAQICANKKHAIFGRPPPVTCILLVMEMNPSRCFSGIGAKFA